MPTAALADLGEREDALREAGDLDGAADLNVATWLGPEARSSARDAVLLIQRRAFEVQLAAATEPDTASEPDNVAPIDIRVHRRARVPRARSARSRRLI